MSVFIGHYIDDGLTVDQLIEKLQQLPPEQHGLNVIAEGIPVRGIELDHTSEGDPYLRIE